MERLTYRNSDGRALLTNKGMKIYCSTQATADILCKYEEILNADKPDQYNGTYLPKRSTADYAYLKAKMEKASKNVRTVLTWARYGHLGPYSCEKVKKLLAEALEALEALEARATVEQREATPWLES